MLPLLVMLALPAVAVSEKVRKALFVMAALPAVLPFLKATPPPLLLVMVALQAELVFRRAEKRRCCW